VYKRQTLSGLTSISAKAYVLATLIRMTGRRFAVITPSNDELDTWESDLSFWLGQLVGQHDGHGTGLQTYEVIAIPGFETDPYSGVSPHAQTLERRALALWKLADSAPSVVVTSIRAILGRTVDPKHIASLGCLLRQGQDTPLEEVIADLEATGFAREDPIYNLGQFSVRGGILDVWSPDAVSPFRVEFFGDTVDSIRTFDPETQLSTGHLESASIAPMREFRVSRGDLVAWASSARERFLSEAFARALRDRTEFADNDETFAGWEFLLPLVRPLDGTIFDFLDDITFVVDEPTVIGRLTEDLLDDLGRRCSYLSEHGELCLAPDELFLTPAELREQIDSVQRLELRALGRAASRTDDDFALNGNHEFAGQQPLFLFASAEGSYEHEIAVSYTHLTLPTKA
jgi:transcription-repair coupling factor (superfamily II helicase)